jgi:hypothetical protein
MYHLKILFVTANENPTHSKTLLAHNQKYQLYDQMSLSTTKRQWDGLARHSHLFSDWYLGG